MRRTNALACFGATLLLFAVACNESETQAKEPLTTPDLPYAEPPADPAKISFGEIQNEVQDLGAAIARELGTITDQASALKAADVIGPLASQLESLKQKLGASLPSMESLESAIQAVEARFASDPAVMDTLKPLLERLRGLLQ
jgi:hypothetical protein